MSLAMRVSRSRGTVGIIHAYPSQYLIDTLIAGGWEPVLIGPANEPFRSVLPKDALVDTELNDAEAFMAAVARAHACRPLTALLPVYEGATLLTAQLGERLSLTCVPTVAALASRNKYFSNQIWASTGVPVPRTVPVIDWAHGYRLIEETIGYPCVLKLADSMNSQGVVKITDRMSYQHAVEQLSGLLGRPRDFNRQLDRNRWAYGQADIKIIAQEFCAGVEVGVDVLIDGPKSVVLGIFEKAPTEGPCFAESMSVWPTSLGDVKERQLGDLATQAVRALSATRCIAHVEMRYSTDGKPRVLEAGLRPGGAYTVRAVEKLCGINPYLLLAALYAGQPLPAIAPPSGAALYGGVVYPRSGILRAVTGTDGLVDLPGMVDVQILNSVGDRVYALPESAQPHFCYYLLYGSDRNDVVRTHERIQSRVCLTIE